MHGLGRPDKTEFPPGWDEDRIVDEVLSVANRPDNVRPLPRNRWEAIGVGDGVIIKVVLNDSGQILAAWPLDGPGVRRNPRR